MQINRLWTLFKDPHPQIVLWLEHRTNAIVQIVTLREWCRVLCTIRRADTTSRKPPNYCSSAGILENSEQYFVYWSLLYCDDLNVSNPLVPKEFAGDCYIIYFQVPCGSGKQRSAIRTISLTPSDISTSHALDYLIPGQMKGATDRLICWDAKGSSLPIFLNVCCILGDYTVAPLVMM